MPAVHQQPVFLASEAEHPLSNPGQVRPQLRAERSSTMAS